MSISRKELFNMEEKYWRMKVPVQNNERIKIELSKPAETLALSMIVLKTIREKNGIMPCKRVKLWITIKITGDAE